MNCSDARTEIVSLLYGELDPTSRGALERHLDSCAACREECDGHRRTMRRLDQWDVPAPFVAARRPRRAIARRRSWVIPTLVGVAAAVLAFVTLMIFGAEARIDRGRITFSLRLPGAESALDAVEPVGRGELERVLAPIVADLVEVDRRVTEGQITLVRAVQRARTEDARRYERALATIARGAAADAERTRRALDDVMILAVSYPTQGIEPSFDK